MAEFTYFEVNGDPLTASWLRVGSTGQAIIEDDDGWLEPDSEDGGVQFSIDGDDFTSSAWPDYQQTGGNVEIFSANIWLFTGAIETVVKIFGRVAAILIPILAIMNAAALMPFAPKVSQLWSLGQKTQVSSLTPKLTRRQ